MIRGYMDTNVFGDFAEGTLPAKDFQKLKSSVKAGKLQIVYSMSLMDEQAGHCIRKPWGKKAAQMAFDICYHPPARFHVEILSDEIVAVLDGKPPADILMDAGKSDTKDFEKNWKILAANPFSIKPWIQKFAQQEVSNQNRFDQGFKDAKAEIEKLREDGKKKFPFTFLEWRAKELKDPVLYKSLTETALRHAGRPESDSLKLLATLDQTKAFRMYLDVHLAYTYSVYEYKISLKRSFSKDLLHSLYANCCEFFVTQDEGFRKVMELVPPEKRCKVYSWSTFAGTLE